MSLKICLNQDYIEEYITKTSPRISKAILEIWFKSHNSTVVSSLILKVGLLKSVSKGEYI